MTSNLKIILSAVGVAALLASPAMAKTERHHQAAPSLTNVPAEAHGSGAPNEAPAVTIYAPDLKVQAHSTGGQNPDFQSGSEK